METACKGPIIQVTALRKEYPVGEEVVVALKSIDLAHSPGRDLLHLRHLDLARAPCSTN